MFSSSNRAFTNLDVDGVLFLAQDMTSFSLVGSSFLFWYVPLISENIGDDGQEKGDLKREFNFLLLQLITVVSHPARNRQMYLLRILFDATIST